MLPDLARSEARLETIRHYLDAWNEPVPDLRNTKFEKVMSEQFLYEDPLTLVTDIASLSQYVQTLRDQTPGLVGESYGEVHHSSHTALFHWRFHADGARNVFQGLDVVSFDDRSRITKILGFFGL